MMLRGYQPNICTVLRGGVVNRNNHESMEYINRWALETCGAAQRFSEAPNGAVNSISRLRRLRRTRPLSQHSQT